MFQRWLFWPLLATVLGFAFGGATVWSIYKPNHQAHVEQADKGANAERKENQPSKTFGERLAIIWDRTWEDAVAFYTFVLAIFTGLLALVAGTQIGFLIRADKTSRITAEAARDSANALKQSERPYIFIWGMEGIAPSITFDSPAHGREMTVRNSASFMYTVSNRGKHTAVIEDVKIACGYPRDAMLPPLIGIGDHEFLRTPLLGANEDAPRFTHNVPWNRFDPQGAVSGLRNNLIFRIVICYHGPFSRGHETSQCWRYISSANGFAEVIDERYTYNR